MGGHRRRVEEEVGGHRQRVEEEVEEVQGLKQGEVEEEEEPTSRGPWVEGVEQAELNYRHGQPKGVEEAGEGEGLLGVEGGLQLAVERQVKQRGDEVGEGARLSARREEGWFVGERTALKRVQR